MSNGKGASLYDFYKTNGLSVVTVTEGPSLTRQEFVEECDINTVMKRYEAHVGTGPGFLPAPAGEPMYIDFSEMPQDLMGFMKLQMDASEAFMRLPAGVRREFDNDPLQFCDYAADPGNIDQMREWGLAPPAKAPAAVVTPGGEPTAGGSGGRSGGLRSPFHTRFYLM